MEVKNKQHLKFGIDICNTVRSTLGPKGMNKMVVVENKPIITNDGATIIKNLEITHPIGHLFKSLAESQEKSVGDGTTTSMIITGQLLENASDLLNKNVHPTTIINGYNIALKRTIEFILSKQEPAEIDKVMRTTFGSKINPNTANRLTELLKNQDVSNLKFALMENKSPSESHIIKGFQFEGHTLNDRTPQKVDGNVAILDLQTNPDSAKVTLNTTEELNKYNENSKQKKMDIVNRLIQHDVKCLFYTDTNPQFESFLSEVGIMGVVIFRRDNLDNISRATNAKIIGDPTLDYTNSIGNAKVEYLREDGQIKIESENSNISTLVLCAPTKHTLEETERALDDVVRVMKHLNSVVIGGGAFEIELASHLRKFAKEIPGKEQVVVDKFADAVESIPMILAENCGFDAMELLTLLRMSHENGNIYMGIDPINRISDAKERGIMEPSVLKLNALTGATEVANLLLKLDDIYTGSEKK